MESFLSILQYKQALYQTLNLPFVCNVSIQSAALTSDSICRPHSTVQYVLF